MGTSDTGRLNAPGLDASLTDWLDSTATRLDTGTDLKGDVVPRLASAGLFRFGVSAALGGSGGDTIDAIASIAAMLNSGLTVDGVNRRLSRSSRRAWSS